MRVEESTLLEKAGRIGVEGELEGCWRNRAGTVLGNERSNESRMEINPLGRTALSRLTPVSRAGNPE